MFTMLFYALSFKDRKFFWDPHFGYFVNIDVTPRTSGVSLTTVNLRKTCVSHIMRPIHE